jgi:putative tryptophan/tyrosine transport system substrate-binding protein
MRRRSFIRLLGSTIVMGSSLTAHGQQSGGMRRIGVLMSYPETDPDAQAFLAAFRDGLRKLGWMERSNIRIDVRWTSPGNAEVMQQSAKELVALQPDLLLGHTTTASLALQKETRAIPIIFAWVSDPVGSGLVRSFPHPGGNVTGFMVMEPTMAGKWLELLHEIAPRVVGVAFLYNPATATYAEYYLKPFKAVAASLGLEPIASPSHASRTALFSSCRTPSLTRIARRLHLWRRATISLPSVRSASMLKSAACCRTEMKRLIIFGAQHNTQIGFSRARSRATFPSRRR